MNKLYTNPGLIICGCFLLWFDAAYTQNKMSQEGNFEIFSGYASVCNINTQDCNNSDFRATFQDNCLETSWKVSHGTPEVCNNGGNYHVHLWSGDFNLNGTVDRGEGLFYECELEVGRYHELTLRMSSRARIDKINLRYASGLQHKARNSNIWNIQSSFYQIPNNLSSNRIIKTINNFNSNGSWQTMGPFGFVPTNNGSYIWVYPEDGSSNEGGSSPVDFLFLDDFVLESCPTFKVFSITSNLPRLTTTNQYISTASSVTVQSNQNVTFQAGNYITLKAGFRAVQGSNFTARIGPCSTEFCFSDPRLRTAGPAQADIIRDQHNETTEEDIDEVAQIFPNPSSGRFKIQSRTNDPITKLFIFDQTGRKVYEFKGKPFAVTEIDLSEQPEGIFLIRITTESGLTVSKKIILNGI